MPKITCPRENCRKQAIINTTFGVLPCKSCQKKDEKIKLLRRSPEFYSLSKQDRVIQQRDRHSKDTLQPWDNSGKGTPSLDFVKAYPEHRDQYFSQDELRKL